MVWHKHRDSRQISEMTEKTENTHFDFYAAAGSENKREMKNNDNRSVIDYVDSSDQFVS